MKKRLTAILLLVSLLSSLLLSGCMTAGAASTDLMKGVKASEDVPQHGLVLSDAEAATDFGVRLLQSLRESGENSLISPVSILYALGMTMNGAAGETRAQMEETLGFSAEDLNIYLHSYKAALPATDNKRVEMPKLNISNGIWFRDMEGLNVKPEFLQTNADYYGAEARKALFTQATVDEINGWVSKNTDGMIPGIVNNLDETLMVLVNALCFDGKWDKEYEPEDVTSGEFTTASGAAQPASYLNSNESFFYEDESCLGVMKQYQGRQYAFVGLLPNEGISLDEFIGSLTGEKLQNLLYNPQHGIVHTRIPKFEGAQSYELADTLMEMGMADAFSDAADFSNMADYPLHIGFVKHKTYIKLDEHGTRAAAVTAVGMSGGTGAAVEPRVVDVYLERPFVYLLIDMKTRLPIFIGTVESLG